MSDLDLAILKREKQLTDYGVSNLRGFKLRFETFYDKLEKLAESCGVSPIQYLSVLESNWRELYEFQEMDFYKLILMDLNNLHAYKTKQNLI